MTAPHLRTAWFTPAFIGQVSVAQLEQARAAVEQALGPFADVRPQPGGSYLLVFRAGVVRTQVALDGQGRIGALGFGSPKPDVNRVDVGGYRLYLQCIGAGSPTVVLEAGLGSPSEVWGLVQPGVARFTRVCAYDRAGVGGSDAGPRPRTSGTIVAALHTLLRRAGVGGPYVLVGHSIGGFHARLYAHRYPREVAGMVLVDASHPDQLARELAALPPYRTGESAALAAVRADLADVRPDPQEGFAWAPTERGAGARERYARRPAPDGADTRSVALAAAFPGADGGTPGGGVARAARRAHASLRAQRPCAGHGQRPLHPGGPAGARHRGHPAGGRCRAAPRGAVPLRADVPGARRRLYPVRPPRVGRRNKAMRRPMALH